MSRARHYKRVAIIGTAVAAILAGCWRATTLPLRGLLRWSSVFVLGWHGVPGQRGSWEFASPARRSAPRLVR